MTSVWWLFFWGRIFQGFQYDICLNLFRPQSSDRFTGHFFCIEFISLKTNEEVRYRQLLEEELTVEDSWKLHLILIATSALGSRASLRVSRDSPRTTSPLRCNSARAPWQQFLWFLFHTLWWRFLRHSLGGSFNQPHGWGGTKAPGPRFQHRLHRGSQTSMAMRWAVG